MKKIFLKVQGCFLFCLSFLSTVFAQEEIKKAAEASTKQNSADAVAQMAKTLAPSNLKDVATEQIETARKLIDIVVEFFVNYSFQFLGGIIVLVIGWLITKKVCSILENFLQKKKADITITKFAVAIVKILIMSFAAIVALGKFGIEIAPLIAGLSVLGVGVGLAVQGPLTNFTSGAVLIFTKPFKVGDIIEVAGMNGEVTDMKLARTELRTVDGNMVIIPNKHIIGEIIQNFSTARKLDLVIGVAYETDMDKALKVVTEIIKKDKRVIKEPVIGINEFADSSVNINARLWCKQDNYWDVLHDLNKAIFDAFAKENIVIPFPQRDVHIIKGSI